MSHRMVTRTIERLLDDDDLRARFGRRSSSVRPMQEGARPHTGRETRMKIVEK